MDKVLIVDADQENLNRLKEGLDKLHQFIVRTASDGEEALEVLEREPISVLVTATQIPKRDGIELLAYMTRNHPTTPCIVMTTGGKPWFKKKMDQQAVLYHIEQPFEVAALVSAIFVGLNIKDEGIAYKGMSMSSFLPLIEADSKTCRLEVKTAGKGKGYLYFEGGVLIDAHYSDRTGEEAAREIVGWERIEINFTDLPKRRSTKRVKTGIMDLAGATWHREECDIAGARNGDQGMSRETPGILDAEDADAVESEAGTPEQERLSAALQSHVELLRAVKGYQAVGIMSFDGGVLAHDTIDETIDLTRLGSAFNNVFRLSNEASPHNGFDECHGLTIHTRKGIVLISSTGMEAEHRFRLIGVVSAGGNWHFMKIQLEEMLPKILAALSTP